jgi:hypothetical protein
MTTKTTHIVANAPDSYTSLEITVDPHTLNHIAFSLIDDQDEDAIASFTLPRDGARELARFILDETA